MRFPISEFVAWDATRGDARRLAVGISIKYIYMQTVLRVPVELQVLDVVELEALVPVPARADGVTRSDKRAAATAWRARRRSQTT